MRINKFLASAGIASRRKVEEYIRDGRVKVNNIVVCNLSTDINENDIVMFDEKLVKNTQKYEYYMLNKPKGYVSTACDDRGRKTVVELIKSNQRIYPVGRLDFESEGLLLLTNDGELTNKLTHPKHNISKTYIVKIDSTLFVDEKKKLENGVVIDNYKLHPCKIRLLETVKDCAQLEIVIFEGRNREIRKMFETIGKKVIYLKRIKIENLSLGKIKSGEYRELTQKEVEYLKSL